MNLDFNTDSVDTKEIDSLNVVNDLNDMSIRTLSDAEFSDVLRSFDSFDVLYI